MFLKYKLQKRAGNLNSSKQMIWMISKKESDRIEKILFAKLMEKKRIGLKKAK